jgi:hypothetical protein
MQYKKVSFLVVVGLGALLTACAAETASGTSVERENTGETKQPVCVGEQRKYGDICCWAYTCWTESGTEYPEWECNNTSGC